MGSLQGYFSAFFPQYPFPRLSGKRQCDVCMPQAKYGRTEIALAYEVVLVYLGSCLKKLKSIDVDVNELGRELEKEKKKKQRA